MKRRDALRKVSMLIAVLVSSSCSSEAPLALRSGAVGFTETVNLPPPDTVGTVPLESALARRRSTYAFRPEALPLHELGQLFWAAQGTTSANGKRTAPSAGALYPLEIYALTDASLLHYLPEGHRAERRAAPPWRQRIQAAAYGQKVVGRAPVLIVVAAVPERTRRKYGARAESDIDREAGHATQNILLQVTALGLAAVPVGGIDSKAVGRVLALPPGHVVLYVIPVGYPVPR